METVVGARSGAGTISATGVEVVTEPRRAGLVVMHVLGEIDLLGVSLLRPCFEHQLQNVRALVLDFTETSYLSAAGLSLLLQTGADARSRNIPWALAAARPVLRPIEVTGLERRLPVYREVPPAVDAVLAPGRSMSA
ncbi:hypothetical protein GCM10009676_11870 [Prauserella halophila]|uniref:STAS domain-containing protein n=1 Tax=Prauserella halophila TaxID=185641 RepID=A0ABP4GMT9_9PSEU|nr:STAS domain-containing protein [Prauserella halophila]MCP2236594.1 anti-anti-sigma factor [Prauserella halophila]